MGVGDFEVDEIVTEGGLTILEKIPLAVGMSVEVIILDHSVSGRKLDPNTDRRLHRRFRVARLVVVDQIYYG